MGTPLCLIVAKEAAIRGYLKTILERQQFRTLEAENVVEAFKLIQKLRGGIDLILGEVRMPGDMDGVDLASPGILPQILVPSDPSDSHLRLCRHRGSKAFVRRFRVPPKTIWSRVAPHRDRPRAHTGPKGAHRLSGIDKVRRSPRPVHAPLIIIIAAVNGPVIPCAIAYFVISAVVCNPSFATMHAR